MLHEIRAPFLYCPSALEESDLTPLRRVAERLSSQLDDLALPLQAVHGDASPANVLNTTRGVLWTDWEDTFLAPTAWDLGCSGCEVARPASALLAGC